MAKHCDKIKAIMVFKSFTSRTENCPNKQEIRKWFILFDLIIYSEIATKSLFALSRSKNKLSINTIQFWYFQYQRLAPALVTPLCCASLPLCLRTVLCSLFSRSPISAPASSHGAPQTQTPSIIKKERDTPYYDLIFLNHNALWHRPGSQGYWQHIMPVYTALYTRYILPSLCDRRLWLRLRGKSGHPGPGSGSATLSLKHQVVVFSGIYTDTFDIVSRSPGRDCAALKDEIY